MSDPFHHVPVMADEIVALFAPVPPGLVLDATLGGGGHAELILAAHPHLSVLGLDRDDTALAAARQRLERFGDRAIIVHSRFDFLQTVMSTANIDHLSGALFDLGVSVAAARPCRARLLVPQRRPLDMRMDRERGVDGRRRRQRVQRERAGPHAP